MHIYQKSKLVRIIFICGLVIILALFITAYFLTKDYKSLIAFFILLVLLPYGFYKKNYVSIDHIGIKQQIGKRVYQCKWDEIIKVNTDIDGKHIVTRIEYKSDQNDINNEGTFLGIRRKPVINIYPYYEHYPEILRKIRLYTDNLVIDSKTISIAEEGLKLKHTLSISRVFLWSFFGVLGMCLIAFLGAAVSAIFVMMIPIFVGLDKLERKWSILIITGLVILSLVSLRWSLIDEAPIAKEFVKLFSDFDK